MAKHSILNLIDEKLEANQEDGRRGHLGGSLIGTKCLRALYFTHRWYVTEKHDGKLLRLFNRGHLEEFRFVEWLRLIGISITDADPISGGQIRISDCRGHFGGSLDGEMTNVPNIEEFGLTLDSTVLAEFKTHGLKSFTELVKRGVKIAKPEHFAQCQVYMHKRGIKLALYMGINKNTDEIHCEWIHYDSLQGAGLIAKAFDIVFWPRDGSLPPRITNNPSWYECRFCKAKKVCHYGAVPAKSCRSCESSFPVEEGEWYCNEYNVDIPLEQQRLGCDKYKAYEAN